MTFPSRNRRVAIGIKENIWGVDCHLIHTGALNAFAKQAQWTPVSFQCWWAIHTSKLLKIYFMRNEIYLSERVLRLDICKDFFFLWRTCSVTTGNDRDFWCSSLFINISVVKWYVTRSSLTKWLRSQPLAIAYKSLRWIIIIGRPW